MAIATLLEDGHIEVEGTANELRFVSRIPGAKRRPNSPAWTLPATLDSCVELQNQRIPFSEELNNYAARQQRVQQYIEKVKLKQGEVKPLQPVPIKPEFHLYNHQIKAFNIALALFGRGAKKSEGR